jgi:hypothetical protein
MMAAPSAAGSGLEGLVGGFLLGSDLSRRRRTDADTAAERQRRIQQEDADRRALTDARGRQTALQDLTLAREHGLAFGPRPKMSLEDLRTGVGESLRTFDQLETSPAEREQFLEREARGDIVPPGFHRVGPSSEERTLTASDQARQLRVATGERIASDFGIPASGESIAGAAEMDVLDELLSRYDTPEGGYSVNADGITARFDSESEAIAARGRLTQPEAPKPPDAGREFDQANALADDFWREAQIPVDVASAVMRARAAGDTPIGDQTKIIALNKLLDPGSIVREGEFNRVGQAGGLSVRAQFYYEQMKDGRLPETLRAALEEEIDSQARVAAEAFGPTMARYRQRAEAFGLDPSQIVFDPFAGAGGADTGAGRFSPDNPFAPRR